MALINQQGKYIKLYSDGTYEVYSSAAARDRHRSSPDSAIIIRKYKQLMRDLESNKELWYYNPVEFDRQHSALDAEYQLYCYNLMNYTTSGEYPIMAQYYPDVKNTIPDIVERGCISFDATDSTTSTYEVAKNKQRWGKTIDA